MVVMAGSAVAAGELGTGVPSFGSYSDTTGQHVRVWRVDEATIPFPSGCTSLVLTPSTMGQSAFKIAVATMLAARLANRKVRFYTHGAQESCSVDYVEML